MSQARVPHSHWFNDKGGRRVLSTSRVALILALILRARMDASTFLSVDTARISELLGPFLMGETLSSEQLSQVSTYIDILLKWNARINLTAVRSENEIVTRHFGESFFAARYLLQDAESGTTVFDVGSGAGFPGIPLKLYAPQISLTLIESQNKKAIFLREVIRALSLVGVEVTSARAETVRDCANLVTLRAVERFEDILPVAARLVIPGGSLGVMAADRQLEAARRVLSGDWRTSDAIPFSNSRVVAVWRNTSQKSR